LEQTEQIHSRKRSLSTPSAVGTTAWQQSILAEKQSPYRSMRQQQQRQRRSGLKSRSTGSIRMMVVTTAGTLMLKRRT